MAVRSDDKPILERIEKVLAELSRSVSPTPALIDAPTPTPAPDKDIRVNDASSAERLNLAIAWIRARAKRDQVFGDDLFFDPAWSILLQLYVHHCQRTAMSITSLCVAAKIPPSTGLRWIALLEKRGLVSRQADPFDRRKSYAILTDEAIERVERAMDDVMESNRPLGIEHGGRVN